MSEPLETQILSCLEADSFSKGMPKLLEVGHFAHLRAVGALAGRLAQGELSCTALAEGAASLIAQKLTPARFYWKGRALAKTLERLAQEAPDDELNAALALVLKRCSMFMSADRESYEPHDPLLRATAPTAARLGEAMAELDRLLDGQLLSLIGEGLVRLHPPGGSPSDAWKEFAQQAHVRHEVEWAHGDVGGAASAAAGGPAPLPISAEQVQAIATEATRLAELGREAALEALAEVAERAIARWPEGESRSECERVLQVAKRARADEAAQAEALKQFEEWNEEGVEDDLQGLLLNLLAVAAYRQIMLEVAGPEDVDFERDGPEICLQVLVGAAQILGANL